ncbi:MAG TPA: diguanylate cyclase [Holophaga sp.]|nr:diguanylate cyclase [Holophaga sp.]
MDPAFQDAAPGTAGPGLPQDSGEALRILTRAVEQSPVSVIITDREGVIQYVNPKFTRLMGWTREEAVGRKPSFLKGGSNTRDFYRDLWETIIAGREWRGLFHNRTKAGELVWELGSISPIRDEQGRITHFVGVKEDITELKRLQDQMTRLAHYDQLTGLPNRALFMDRLGRFLARARRHETPFAVLYMDLDAFKAVNDTLGHAAGDALLAEVGRRLQACVRESDTVARMGGDEFTVLLEDAANREDAGRVAEQIVATISRPYAIQGAEVRVGISIGVAFHPLDGSDSDALLRAADAALYRAKDAGRGGVRFQGQR